MPSSSSSNKRKSKGGVSTRLPCPADLTLLSGQHQDGQVTAMAAQSAPVAHGRFTCRRPTAKHSGVGAGAGAGAGGRQAGRHASLSIPAPPVQAGSPTKSEEGLPFSFLAFCFLFSCRSLYLLIQRHCPSSRLSTLRRYWPATVQTLVNISQIFAASFGRGPHCRARPQLECFGGTLSKPPKKQKETAAQSFGCPLRSGSEQPAFSSEIFLSQW